PGGYAELAMKKFEKFRSHAAVQRLSAMPNFTGNLPSQYAVYLSPPPALEELYPAPPIFVQAAGGRKALKEYRDGLRAFYNETEFTVWLTSATKDFEKMEKSFSDTLGKRDIETPLEDYAGVRTWDKVTVYLSGFYA